MVSQKKNGGRHEIPQPELPRLSVLRAFHAVAEHASLTKAAASLNRSQPALTIAIAKLEKQLEVSLLERGRSGAHLTPAGRILQMRCARMLDRLEAAVAAAATIPGRTRWSDQLTEAQVRSLAALADHTTLERAAEAIGVAIPSLRRTMQSLELLLGRPLLQPTAQGLSASRLGADTARRIKLSLEEIEAGLDEIDIARGRIRSRIAIGVVPLSATRPLTLAINELLRAYPEATVAIAHGSYDPLLDDLRSARINILYGVLRLPAWVNDATEEALFHDPYVVAVRRGHPLTRVPNLRIEDLARYDWIAPKPGTPRRSNLELMFAPSAQPPRVTIETSSLTVQRALLASSDRMTLLTRHEMQERGTARDLVGLPVETPPVRAPDGITMRNDWQPTPVEASFLSLLRQHCRDRNAQGK